MKGRRMPAQLTREQVPAELTWDLSHIYGSPDEWEADYQAVEAALAALAAHQGRLGDGPAALLAFLRERDDAAERFEKVAAYASLSASADGMSAWNQAMASRAAALGARAAAAVAFVAPAVLALPDGVVESWLAAEPALAPYQRQLRNIARFRAHVLTPETEHALASFGEVFSLPRAIWQRATATDLTCPPIEDEQGQAAPVTIARYVFGYAQSADRAVRRSAYESLAAGMDRHKHTLATGLAAEIKGNVVLARLRRYDSAVQMILDREQVPESVYRNVLSVVHDEIRPHVHRLNALRQRVLGLDRLRFHDLRAPLDPAYAPATTFDEVGALVRAGLAVLGDEHDAIVAAAFRDRWIDRADNIGKRSGAFCSSVYGVHPYVFTTWQDNLRSALVTAHELGHASHMLLAARNQIISNASLHAGALTGAAWPRFFIEAPSTANEILLGQHILATTDDPRLRRFVTEQFLGAFTHNMVTHLLEGHFEQRLYDLAEADQPITTQAIMDAQAAVFERFYGDTVLLDDGARLYWAQQPHFYVGLYPYTYAAGLACAYNVVEAIQEQGQPAVTRWLDTLRAGLTQPPVELARQAGVDMTSPEPLRRAVAFFGRLVDELERSYT